MPPSGPPTAPSPSGPLRHPSLSCWLPVSQTSWPDTGRGVPSSCFSHHPSQAATDAASRKQSPSKSWPGKWDPSQPSHPSGAEAYCLTAALAHRKVEGEAWRVRRGAFPGPGGASYGRCIRSHHSPLLVSQGPLVPPCPSPGCQVLCWCRVLHPRSSGSFPARATHSGHPAARPPSGDHWGKGRAALGVSLSHGPHAVASVVSDSLRSHGL